MKFEEVEQGFRQLLREGFTRDEAKRILLVAGYPEAFVQDAHRHLRVVKRWQDVELQDLLRGFKRRPIRQLSRELKRTEEAVYKQAERMKRSPPIKILRKATLCPKCKGKAEVYVLRPNPEVPDEEVWVAKCKANPPCPGLHFLKVVKEHVSLAEEATDDLTSSRGHSTSL